MEAQLQSHRGENLLLHCGAHAVDRVIIGTTRTPEPTVTWTPLPHMTLVQEVEQVLCSTNPQVSGPGADLEDGSIANPPTGQVVPAPTIQRSTVDPD
jgi:hypothetical protein